MENITNIITVVLHLNTYLDTLVAEYGAFMYGFLFLIIFFETGIVVTPFLPGDSLLFAAGAIASRGGLKLLPLLLLCLTAAILGDTLNYWLGRFSGERLLAHFPKLVKPAYLERTHEFFKRFGSKTVVLCRFVPVVRTLAPFLAGAGEMRYGRFMRYNALGALLWVFLLIPAGYFFSTIPVVENNFSIVLLAIIVLSFIPVVTQLYRERRKVLTSRADGE